MDKTKKIKKKILKSARKSFIQLGIDGARMQQIADLAGVNKALLHYHFRNKELLYEQVVLQEQEKLWRCFEYLESPTLSFPEKVKGFIEAVEGLHQSEKECIPFLISEMDRHPERLVPLLSQRPNLTHFLDQVKAGMEFGFIRKQPPLQVLIHLLSLSLFLPLSRTFMAHLLTDVGGATEALGKGWWEGLPESVIRQLGGT